MSTSPAKKLPLGRGTSTAATDDPETRQLAEKTDCGGGIEQGDAPDNTSSKSPPLNTSSSTSSKQKAAHFSNTVLEARRPTKDFTTSLSLTTDLLLESQLELKEREVSDEVIVEERQYQKLDVVAGHGYEQAEYEYHVEEILGRDDNEVVKNLLTRRTQTDPPLLPIGLDGTVQQRDHNIKSSLAASGRNSSGSGDRSALFHPKMNHRLHQNTSSGSHHRNLSNDGYFQKQDAKLCMYTNDGKVYKPWIGLSEKEQAEGRTKSRGRIEYDFYRIMNNWPENVSTNKKYGSNSSSSVASKKKQKFLYGGLLQGGDKEKENNISAAKFAVNDRADRDHEDADGQQPDERTSRNANTSVMTESPSRSSGSGNASSFNLKDSRSGSASRPTVNLLRRLVSRAAVIRR
ncbi:unnamed protein product [Amoebophrya sp. A120]|nr:unnamed protein product [Amoebophrya sp. A120]|eukprot:GSA120T00009287001.1